jgi:hypothetical protein
MPKIEAKITNPCRSGAVSKIEDERAGRQKNLSLFLRFFRRLDLCWPRNNGGCPMDFQKELIAEYDREVAKTRKILEAIPADADFTYKPHPKSMSLGQLAGHIVETAGQWAISALALDKLEFPADHKFEPYIPASKDALLERFDKDTGEAKALLNDFAPQKWDGNWPDLDRRFEVPCLPRLGSRPPDSPPRPVGCLRAPPRPPASWNLWAVGGRYVVGVGNWPSSAPSNLANCLESPATKPGRWGLEGFDERDF